MNVHLQFLVNDDTQVHDACFEDNPWETLYYSASGHRMKYGSDNVGSVDCSDGADNGVDCCGGGVDCVSGADCGVDFDSGPDAADAAQHNSLIIRFYYVTLLLVSK